MKAKMLTALSATALAFAAVTLAPQGASACPGDKKPSLSCPGDKKPQACPGDKKPQTCPDDDKKKIL